MRISLPSNMGSILKLCSLFRTLLRIISIFVICIFRGNFYDNTEILLQSMGYRPHSLPVGKQ